MKQYTHMLKHARKYGTGRLYFGCKCRWIFKSSKCGYCTWNYLNIPSNLVKSTSSFRRHFEILSGIYTILFERNIKSSFGLLYPNKTIEDELSENNLNSEIFQLQYF